MRPLRTRLQEAGVNGGGGFVLSEARNRCFLQYQRLSWRIDLRSGGCVLFDLPTGEDQNSRMTLQGLS